jgi:hypothetical protein
MNSKQIRRALPFVAMSLMTFPVLAGPPAVGKSPWASLPALPTSCYSEQDTFVADAAKMSDALSEDADRQNGINLDLQSQAAEADPAVKQQRIQAIMMKNPQKAMEMLTGVSDPAKAAQEAAALSASEKRLDKEFEDLVAKYDAAVKTNLDPALAKVIELRGPGGETTQHVNLAEYRPAIQKANAEYERLCASWWKAGPFHAYLGQYRTFLEKQQAPAQAKEDENKKFQLDLAGVPTATYASTADMRAAREFIDRAKTIFEKRLERAVPEPNMK